jgi:hypothetical protein
MKTRRNVGDGKKNVLSFFGISKNIFRFNIINFTKDNYNGANISIYIYVKKINPVCDKMLNLNSEFFFFENLISNFCKIFLLCPRAYKPRPKNVRILGLNSYILSYVSQMFKLIALFFILLIFFALWLFIYILLINEKIEKKNWKKSISD